MRCGGEINRFTAEGIETETIKGDGISCIDCGYRPKEKETPQVLKDFSGLIQK